MADTLLKVDGINVYYGNIHAVKDISFTVNAGEIDFVLLTHAHIDHSGNLPLLYKNGLKGGSGI